MNRALYINLAILLAALGALAGGFIARALEQPAAAVWLWMAGSVPALVWLTGDSIRALRRHEAGIDLLALLSISGAIALQQALTGIVIALMLSTGRVLEAFAQSRAGREMSALLARAPRSANRLEQDQLRTVALDEVVIGDRLLVRAGETVPVDGVLASPAATLDESALTGETSPVLRQTDDLLRSGALNAGEAFEMTAGASAADSTFAGIIRLVESARTSRSPGTRLADRYALWFVPLSLGLSTAAWGISHDPLRALAVLVVATPCPLLLAVPIAIVSGLSNCARRGILVKSGGALEQLARASRLYFDKTGTLTSGQARLVRTVSEPGLNPTEILRLAASLDQMSAHATASAIVAAARGRQLVLEWPTGLHETPGGGMHGLLGGAEIRVGTASFVTGETRPRPPWLENFLRQAGDEGGAAVVVGRNGVAIGALYLADRIRIETPHALRLLRKAGIRRMVMLTGDRPDIAEAIGNAIGIDEIHAGLDPAAKLAVLSQAPRDGTSIMVGDGINDATALAAADVGVAMGARGAAASSEAASVVLLVDRLDRLAEAVHFARSTRRIALQSAMAGMGLSLLAMLVAASGHLSPLAGATLQEGIDILAIASALRALRIAPLQLGRRPLSAKDSQRLLAEHEALVPLLDQLDFLAHNLPGLGSGEAFEALTALDRQLQTQLLPHERADDRQVYPGVMALLGGDDPLAAMSRTHREIFSLIRRLQRAIEPLAASDVPPAALREIQALLYSLDAIVRLHFAQEDELYFTLS